MKVFCCVVFAMVLCLYACNNKPAATKQVTAMDTTRFYPISDFFKSQVDYILLLKKPVYRITDKAGKRDSVALNNDAFKAFAALFMEKDISGAATKQGYRETLFQDMDTKSYTLSYTAIDAATPIQGIDVLLDENTNLVKRIFIRHKLQKGDTTITEQYGWNAFKNCQINRSYSTPGGYRFNELNQVSWTDGPKASKQP